MSRRKRATLTDLLNDLTFRTIYEKYRLLATNLYTWEGLPDGMESKYIENFLFKYGKAIFFKDRDMSYMCLQAMESGKYNVYHEPLGWIATGFNYNKHYSAEDCVVIDNNTRRIPTSDLVMFYVNKITEAERTMDVNVKACKTPIIFACDDKDVLTFKRIFQQVDGNVPAIFADRGLNLNGIEAFDTKASFLGNDLMDYKKSVENELLTLLGVNNLTVDKKERVNVPEANSNNELIQSFADMQFKARELACERINEKYNLKLSVKRNENVERSVENVDKSNL